MKNETNASRPVSSRMTDCQNVCKFMCDAQKSVVAECWSELSSIIKDLDAQLAQIPPLYAQEKLGMKAIVYAHYFCGSTDIFLTECSGMDAFGFVVLNGDYEMSELGSVSLIEIRSIPMLNLDFYWEPIPLDQALHDLNPSYYN